MTASLGQLRGQVLEIAKRMAAEGLVRGTSGNVSARDRPSGNLVITPSGMEYHRLKPLDLVVLDPAGRVVEGKRLPSIENPMHRAIYRARPEVAAVVHTHSVHATALACLGRELPVISTELAALVGATVRLARLAESGTEEFARQAVEGLGGATAVLLQSHGVVAVGHDLNEAYATAWAVETAAELYLLASSLGRPVPLPEDYLARARDFYLCHYGQPAGKEPPVV